MEHWTDMLRLSDDADAPVVITAAGTFPAEGVADIPEWAKGSEPGTITIPERAIDEMVAAFEENDLGVVPFIDDGGHGEKRSSGAFTKLWKDTFTDVHGKSHVGLFGQVDWSTLGKELVGGKQFGYLSGLFGTIGKGGRFALRSATPTNKPVLRILPHLPSIALEQQDEVAITIALEQDDDVLGLAHQMAMASVGGEMHPAADFAYVPDPSKPSTWKFPIYDKAHAANAAARFNQTSIPEADLPSVKKKIAAAHRRLLPDTPLPDVLKLEEVVDDTKGEKHMPENEDVTLELAQKTADDLAAQTLQLEAVKKQTADALAGLRVIQLEADAKKAELLPYDAKTIENLVALSESTFGQTIALSEDGAPARVFDVAYDLLKSAVPVVHTEAIGIVKFEQSKESKTVALEDSKKTLKAMYHNDPKKLAGAIAKLEAEYENDEAGEE